MPADSPFWDFTTATGLTLTAGAGSDWDPLWDVPTVSNRVRTGVPCGTGYFTQVDYGSGGQRRWKLTWDSPRQRNVSCLIQGGLTDAGYVQVKMNGKISEYYLDSPGADGFEYFTLPVKTGRNNLTICCDGFPDTLEFFGAVLGREDVWIDPRDLQGYIP